MTPSALEAEAADRLVLSIPLEPMQKPNIRSKRWKDWRRWADGLIALAQVRGWRPGPEPELLKVVAYFAIPQSWPAERKLSAVGAPHRQKPDANHLWNAVADALYQRDERIACCYCLKLWDDGKGPRLEIALSSPSARGV